MIIKHAIGPIHSTDDTIIAVDVGLHGVRALVRPFDIRPFLISDELELGSVITAPSNDGTKRTLFLIACFRQCKNGWAQADEHIRTGIAYIDRQTNARQYSIGTFGEGYDDLRRGSKPEKINAVLAKSICRFVLFVDVEGKVSLRSSANVFDAKKVWQPLSGEKLIT